MPSLFDKLWGSHEIAVTAGGASIVHIDRVFLHERTGAAALGSLAAAGRSVWDAGRAFVATDHIVDTRPGRGQAGRDATLVPGGQAFITETRAAAKAAGIRVFDVGDPDQGIMHVVSPELGIVLPGLTLVAPDSHTCTQGAVGALAWGIGSTEAEHALATSTLRVSKPQSMRVRFEGVLAAGVTAKDMALALIAAHGAAGGQGFAIEFAGGAVTALGMEARMTLCNMATEFAAFSAVIAPDDVTLDWLKGRRFAPNGADWERAVAAWRGLVSDADAVFDREIVMDAGAIRPMISWGTSPAQSAPAGEVVPGSAEKALAYMGLVAGQGLLGLKIDGAFIGSCTNARLSDLRAAAEVVRGLRVAAGVRALVVPGSSAVKRAAEAEGLDRVFTDAGFEWRESGCSMCFFAGGESFGAGERVISSTNRNFESRQGKGTRTHIASPAVVAASAIAGVIALPEDA
ncbi:3-isopropylmalate dehydratase large subunit 1 [Polymorphobacter multimanifer]|uniref:3-isopropylmalate dehydratase large subunit n=1 Tax=Polymorphobacter multimanifer TaxID=1070431 RepID=UPI00166D8120|nr:3-isopropylmalate dehydratase large subunit [Polymorphobacter multimanifer]GGI84191.1 3-isopropylmalate dehydratase large subunit 1 [Polymorphobacter multimanifer]